MAVLSGGGLAGGKTIHANSARKLLGSCSCLAHKGGGRGPGNVVTIKYKHKKVTFSDLVPV